MSTPDWVTDMFCPILGTLLADIMWVVSIGAILKAREEQSLGVLNPLPFVAGMANCVIWTIYSAMIQDLFVFLANFPGVILCMFYSISALGLLAKKNDEESLKVYSQVENLFMLVISVYTMLALVCGIIVTDSDTNQLIVGSLAMGVNILYYASPCSNLIHVIRTRDASSLFLPMLIANLGCATCWFFYSSIVLKDMFIYGPNVIGIVLTTTAIFCKFWLGDKEPDYSSLDPLLK